MKVFCDICLKGNFAFPPHMYSKLKLSLKKFEGQKSMNSK